MIDFYNNLKNNCYINNFLLENKIFNFSLFKNSKLLNYLKIDKNDWDTKCYFEINSNLGGKDSQQLNKMFFNIYLKWLNKNNYNYEIIEIEESDFGYKKTIFLLKENFSFSIFKSENGIHRIIRKNPLLSSNKIQTSYLNLNIIPKIINKNFFFKKDDLIIETFKSKGAGGQHVNKTNSAVRIIHKKTNIVVNCQSERSQIKNKNKALKLLEFKLIMSENFFSNKYLNTFKCKKNYIKTYYFNNNEYINHTNKKKYILSNFLNSQFHLI